MPCMSSKTFQERYVLEFEKEFEKENNAAEWASSTDGSCLKWGAESHAIDLVRTDAKIGDRQRSSATIALSLDEIYLAIATNTVIRVYDTQAWKIKAELVGHLASVGTLCFLPDAAKKPNGAEYTLLSQDGERNIITWHLGSDGKPLPRTMPFATETLADKAVAAIEGDLYSHHELSTKAVSDIRNSFVKSLKIADTKNRQAGLSKIAGGIPGFGSKYVGLDGQRILHLGHNETTQHMQREDVQTADPLPYLVVRSTSDMNKEICRLTGHTDAVMWASWSPTDPNVIASAAWDGTFRLWKIESSGQVSSRVIQNPKRGQNWSGDFSPDGKYVLLSGTEHVAIYLVETGKEVARLERPELAHWVRYFSWSPSGDAIALASDRSIILWEPFTENGQTEIVKFKLEIRDDDDDETEGIKGLLDSFKRFHLVKWLDDTGNRLCVGTTEGSFLVWDRRQNLKWRFQRTEGKVLDLYVDDVVYIKDTERLVTLDGDWKVRIWQL